MDHTEPYAEIWIRLLRNMQRCKWCGEGEKTLSRNGLCPSCKLCERQLSEARAGLDALPAAASVDEQSSLGMELGIAEMKKRLRVEDGQSLRHILESDNFSARDLERWFCKVAKSICGNSGLHKETATQLRWTFTPRQRQVIAYLHWMDFHASRRGKSLVDAMHAVNLERAKLSNGMD